MVSLSESNNMSFSGGGGINDGDDEPDHGNFSDELRDELLGRGESLIYHTVDTLSIGLLMILSAMSLLVGSWLIPYFCESGSCGLKPLSLLLYSHAAFWGFTLIADQFIQSQHIKVRLRGYLDFYNENRVLSRLPFALVSLWSSLLLLVSTVLNDNCVGEKCGGWLRSSDYGTMLLSAESILVVVILLPYLCRVAEFNRRRAAPDVLRDEMAASSLGFSSPGRVDEELFERQADLIRYLRDENEVLRRRLLHLRSAPTTEPHRPAPNPPNFILAQ